MTWYKIFDTADQAKNRIGDKKIQPVKIGDKHILIARMDERFFAAENECPHQGAKLSEGRIGFQEEVVCPWHGFRFNLKDGKVLTGNCRPLEIFEIRIDNEGFFVKLNI